MILRHHQSGFIRPSSSTTRPTTSTPLLHRASTAAGKAKEAAVISSSPQQQPRGTSSSSSRALSQPSSISSRTSSIPWPSMDFSSLSVPAAAHQQRGRSPHPRACTPGPSPPPPQVRAAASTSNKRRRPPSTLGSSSPPPRFFRRGRIQYSFEVIKRKVSPAARGPGTLKDRLDAGSDESGSSREQGSSFRSRITAWTQTVTVTTATATTTTVSSVSSSSLTPPQLAAPDGTFGPAFGKVFGDPQGVSPASASCKNASTSAEATSNGSAPPPPPQPSSRPLFSPSLVSRQQPKTLAGAPDLSMYLDPLYGIPSATRSREEIERRNAFEEERRCKLFEEGMRARRHTTAAEAVAGPSGTSGRPHAKLPARRRERYRTQQGIEEDAILSDIPSSLSFARLPSSTADAITPRSRTTTASTPHRHRISVVPATLVTQPLEEHDADDEEENSVAYDAYVSDEEGDDVMTSAPTLGGPITITTRDYTWSPELAPTATGNPFATPSPPQASSSQESRWSPVTTPGVHSQTKSVRRARAAGTVPATLVATSTVMPPIRTRRRSSDQGYDADTDDNVASYSGCEEEGPAAEEVKTAKLLAAQRLMNQIISQARARHPAPPTPILPIKSQLRHPTSASRSTLAQAQVRPHLLLPTLSHEPRDQLVAELLSGEDAGPNSSGSAGASGSFNRSTPSLLQQHGSTVGTAGHGGADTTRSSSGSNGSALRTPSLGDCGPTQPRWTPNAEEEEEDPFAYSLRDEAEASSRSALIRDEGNSSSQQQQVFYDWSQEEEFVRVHEPSESFTSLPKRSRPIAILAQAAAHQHERSCVQPTQLAAPVTSRPSLRRRNAATPEDFDDARKAAAAVAAAGEVEHGAPLDSIINTSLTLEASDSFNTAQADFEAMEEDVGDVTRAYMASARLAVFDSPNDDEWRAGANEAFVRYLVEHKKWEKGERSTPPTPCTRNVEGLYGSLPLCETPSPLDLDEDEDEVLEGVREWIDRRGGHDQGEDGHDHGTATVLSSQTQACFPLATSSSSATPHVTTSQSQLPRTTELRTNMLSSPPAREVTMSSSSSSAIWWGQWKHNATTARASSSTSADAEVEDTDMSAQVDADFPLLRITISEPSPAVDTPRHGVRLSRELDAARGMVMLSASSEGQSAGVGPIRGRQMVSPPTRPLPLRTVKHTPSSASSSSRFASARRRIGAKIEDVMRRRSAAARAFQENSKDGDRDCESSRMMLTSTPPPAALRTWPKSSNDLAAASLASTSAPTSPLRALASRHQNLTRPSSTLSFASSSAALLQQEEQAEDDVPRPPSSSSYRRTTSQLFQKLRATPSTLFSAAVGAASKRRSGTGSHLAHASSDATMRTATPPPSIHAAPTSPYEVRLGGRTQQERNWWRNETYAPSPSSSRFPPPPPAASTAIPSAKRVPITEGDLDLSHFVDDDDEEESSCSEEEGSDAASEVVVASEYTFGVRMEVDSDVEDEEDDTAEAGALDEAASESGEEASDLNGDAEAMSIDHKRSDVSMRTTHTGTAEAEGTAAMRDDYEDANGSGSGNTSGGTSGESGSTTTNSFAEASAAMAWPLPPPTPLPPSAVYRLRTERGLRSTSTSTESMRFS